mmetsp:Transcript_34697/g.102981  ORF Transcript_34697/g.102981 Transcript_34697/m.102981 type:complete len:106 (+) Transcript_34697:338-655(+)
MSLRRGIRLATAHKRPALLCAALRTAEITFSMQLTRHFSQLCSDGSKASTLDKLALHGMVINESGGRIHTLHITPSTLSTPSFQRCPCVRATLSTQPHRECGDLV